MGPVSAGRNIPLGGMMCGTAGASVIALGHHGGQEGQRRDRSCGPCAEDTLRYPDVVLAAGEPVANVSD
jgi:hypothetical protein